MQTENKIPKVENISVNQQFIGKCRYGDLCRALGLIPKKSGSSTRKAQEKTIRQYLSYSDDKATNIITIDEIYEKPLPRPRKERISKYLPLIELLLVKWLQENNNRVETSYFNFFQDIQSLNRNFAYCVYSDNLFKQKEGFGKSKFGLLPKEGNKIINDFRYISKSRLNHLVKSALDKLQQKAIIIYSYYATAIDSNGIKRNTIEWEELSDYIMYANQHAFSETSAEYKKQLKGRLLKNMNDLNLNPKYLNSWFIHRDNYLEENYGITKCHKVLDIILTSNREWIESQLLDTKKELNNLLSESLTKSFISHIKKHQQYYPKSEDTINLLNYIIEREVKL